MNQIFIKQQAAYMSVWKRSLTAGFSAQAKSGTGSSVQRLLTIIWQLRSRTGERLEEISTALLLWDTGRETEWPLQGCENTILCRDGDGCGRWSCPAKTENVERYVRGFHEA